VAEANVAAGCLADWFSHAKQRRYVYKTLTEGFAVLGVSPLFEISDQITPWFFPIRSNHPVEFASAMRETGVDCGVWHGAGLVVFPCHQYLTEPDIDYILEAVGPRRHLVHD
jgi:hypothetical protein